MARALRVRVPLKAMCSSIWAMPFSSALSCRVPQATQMPSEADSTSGISSTATRRPLARGGTLTSLVCAPWLGRGGGRRLAGRLLDGIRELGRMGGGQDDHRHRGVAAMLLRQRVAHGRVRIDGLAEAATAVG